GGCQREGRGVFVESRSHGKHHGGDGRGRCPRRLAAGTAKFPSRRLRGIASRGTFGEEIASRRAPDARGRGAAACFNRNADARRFSRNEQEGYGNEDCIGG